MHADRALIGSETPSTGSAGGVPRCLPFRWIGSGDCAYELPAELVEGLLTEGGLALIYGDSNTGKSCLACDLAIHFTLGWSWLGQSLLQGGVVHVAAEGAASIEQRVAAFRKRHSVSLTSFEIVPESVDLVHGPDPAAN